jgi:hypothetical protein
MTHSESVAIVRDAGSARAEPAALARSAVTGLPIVRLGRVISTDDGRTLDDEKR